MEPVSGQIALQGRLTIETVPKLFEVGLRHLKRGNLRADFSQVEVVDSAAIGMLLGWRRAAHLGQRDLRVVRLPGDLLSLARLYGVIDYLNLHDE